MVTWSYLVLLGLYFGLSQAVRLTVPPTATYNAANGRITIVVTFGPQNPTTGPGTPFSHVVQWRDSTFGTQWTNLGQFRPYPQGSATFSTTFPVPSPGNVYQFRDVLSDQNNAVYGNNVPSVTVNTGGGGGSSTPSPGIGPLRFTNPPQATYNGNGQIGGVVTFGVNNPVIGNGGTPQSFTVQYRDQTRQGPWQNLVTQAFPTGLNGQSSFTIPNINVGDVYNVRAIITDNNGRTFNNNQQIPFRTVNTGFGSSFSSSPRPFSSSSPNPLSSSPNTIGGQCLRLTNPPTATNPAFGQIRASITLGPSNPVLGRTATRTPTSFVFQYRTAFANNGGNFGPWTNFGGQRTYPLNNQGNQQFTANVNQLTSGSVYEVRVILFDQNGTPSRCAAVPTTTVGTRCVIPTSTVNINTVTSTVNGAAQTLTARWTFNPQQNTQACQLLGFNVIYTYIGVTGTDRVQTANIVFSNYVQGNPITLQIQPIWSGGLGRFSQTVVVPRNLGK